jgi:hypothetical protein
MYGIKSPLAVTSAVPLCSALGDIWYRGVQINEADAQHNKKH